jgi:lipopolysaccharide transport system ATP-binding protein
MNDHPALIHVTHWKAGSQWVRKVLQDCLPERIVTPEIGSRHFVGAEIREGAVYPTVYVTRQQFYDALLPARWVRFVVIRDLRDTLVSAYFSLRYSHSSITEFINQMRNTLSNLDVESGMVYLMDHWLPDSAKIQSSWVEAGEPVIHFEDLIAGNEYEVFEEILIARAGFPVTRERLRDVLAGNQFENLAGRKPGQENVNEHMRKGIAGDWRNHFTPRVKDEFLKRYGDLLVSTNYEKDLHW